jgi:hypothetical protein
MDIDPVLGSEVYEKVIHEGLSHVSVMSWLNGRVAVLNAHTSSKGTGNPLLPTYNEANFSVHFNKHISEHDRVLKNVRRIVKTKKELGGNRPPPAVRVNIGAAAQSGTETLSAYHAMLDDIAYLRELLSGFKEAQRNKTKAISQQDLSKIQSTMTTISNMTSNMMKFMTTGGLARTAVQYALDSQGRAWAESFEKGLEAVSYKLTEEDLELFRRILADRMEIALRGINEDLVRKFNFK